MELLKLEKRECPIKISLTPLGGYYLLVEFEINGDKHKLCPSHAVSMQFLEFMSAAYMLYCEMNGCDCHNHTFINKNRREVYIDKNDSRLSVVKTWLMWNEEGPSARITLYREVEQADLSPVADKPDPIRIEIDYSTGYPGQGEHFTYSVDGKDLCYAIGKTGTDAIKEYGFHGYFYSTGYDDCIGDWIDINQLLFFKAYALGAMEVRDLTEVRMDNDSCYYRTDFSKELELLLFDM